MVKAFAYTYQYSTDEVYASRTRQAVAEFWIPSEHCVLTMNGTLSRSEGWGWANGQPIATRPIVGPRGSTRQPGAAPVFECEIPDEWLARAKAIEAAQLPLDEQIDELQRQIQELHRRKLEIIDETWAPELPAAETRKPWQVGVAEVPALRRLFQQAVGSAPANSH